MKIPVFLLAAAAICAVFGGTVYAPEDAPRDVRFANPPAASRILPIQHGQPNEPEKVDAVLADLEADGFGGFTGNVNFADYLDSPVAWKAFRHKVEAARARGLSVWLYDEKGYPSCTAGGKTLEGHPEWQARAYLVAVTNVPAGSAALPPSPPGRPVATLRRPSADGKAETVYVVTDDFIREGTHVSVSVSHYKYAYPNLLMAEPTARFIALTHEAYRRELGPSLSAIASTFTDEPSLMTMWMRPMPYLCLPVSDELLAAYAREAGHPLADDVPALVHGAAEGAVAAVRHRYWSMVGARVARNYTGQLTKWADANGLASGGHLLAEESLVAHVPLYGDFFRVLRGLSAPSCDMLQSIPAQVTWLTPLLVGSAGALNGSRYVMSEASDHCQRYRAKGDTRPVYQVSAREIVGSLNRQIWGGVNTFTSYYRWQPFPRAVRRAINEEIGRTVTLVREGHAAADIALLYPADALMVGFEPQRRGGGGAAARRTANYVRSAGQTLFAANRSFLFVDAETLEQAEVRDGLLVKGALRWRTVILPGVSTLPVGAARKLEAFRKAGGLVLALGERPRNSRAAFPDAEVMRLAADWTFLADARVALLADLLDVRHEPALRCVRGTSGVLRTAHRRTAAGDVFFVLNDTDGPWSGAVRLADGGAARIWNPRVGLATSGTGDLALDLPPYGGVVLTTDRPVDGHLNPAASAPFEPALAPLAAPPARIELGKGTYVAGSHADGTDGWHRVETTLTKGGVDTFAFLNFVYDNPPFPAAARGVSFTVRVPGTTGGQATCGIFLRTREGVNWYASGHVSLSEKGAHEVTCAFSDFFPHGVPPGAKPACLRAEDIVRVNFGYGGYFGQEGERVVFETRVPRAFLLAHPAVAATSRQTVRDAALVLRFDDNKPVSQWREIAEIFEAVGGRCSFAVNSAGLNEEQWAALRDLASRGHEIMDHTAQHAVFKLRLDSAAEAEAYRTADFFDHAEGGLVLCRPELDLAHPGNVRVTASMTAGVLRSDDPRFLSAQSFSRKFYVPSTGALYGLGKDCGGGLFRKGPEQRCSDFWGRWTTNSFAACEIVLLDGTAVQPSKDLLRAQAKNSVSRFVAHGLPAPKTWIRPGGWETAVDGRRMEAVYGDEFGYAVADSTCGVGRWSPWNYPSDFAFFDEGKGVEEVYEKAVGVLRGGRSFAYISHQWTKDRPKYLEQCRALAAKLKENGIPMTLYSRIAGPGR